MSSTAGKGRIKNNAHNQAYWERLRKQFETCEYDHTGAYSSYSRNHGLGIKATAESIEETEKMLQSEKYRNWSGNGQDERPRLNKILRSKKRAGSKFR